MPKQKWAAYDQAGVLVQSAEVLWPEDVDPPDLEELQTSIEGQGLVFTFLPENEPLPTLDVADPEPQVNPLQDELDAIKAEQAVLKDLLNRIAKKTGA